MAVTVESFNHRQVLLFPECFIYGFAQEVSDDIYFTEASEGLFQSVSFQGLADLNLWIYLVRRDVIIFIVGLLDIQFASEIERGVAVERKHQFVLCQNYLTAIIVEPVLRYFVEISEVVNFAKFYVPVYIEYADDCKLLVGLDDRVIIPVFEDPLTGFVVKCEY